MSEPMPELTRAIPWKLVAASPDMMDTNFGDRRYPYRWRSSLAIYAYEPDLDTLPPELCEDRLTMVKVSCSITGYQPSASERSRVTFGNVPATEITRLMTDYWGCYGVQLNVAVFPPEGVTELMEYPHVVDFEPKTRDLYQSATAEHEVLSASKSEITTDSSLTTTTSAETTIGAKVGLELGPVKAGAELTHKWGGSQTTASNTATRDATERHQRNGLTTTVNQMYNLLTGYHAGTNRAVFVMLPRPHIQQQDERTFARGFRVIEGMQDFVLVVARPRSQEALRIDAVLETGHFPEHSQDTGRGRLRSPETMLLTSRGLSAEMLVEDRCVRPQRVTPWPEVIIGEFSLPLSLVAIEQALLTGSRGPGRFIPGSIGFDETDYFAKRLAKAVRTPMLDERVATAEGVPTSVVEHLGDRSVRDVLTKMTASQFAQQAQISLAEARTVRRQMLGLPAKDEPRPEKGQ